jgi:hypothetical protein
MAGSVNYLRSAGYDLSRLPMVGASAGALCATLAASGVDMKVATGLALEKATEARVWDRPLLVGGAPACRLPPALQRAGRGADHARVPALLDVETTSAASRI